MGYKVELTPSSITLVKKLPKSFSSCLYGELRVLAENPFLGKRLRPPLAVCFSYSFSFQGTPYRIAYTVFPPERKIIVVLVGPRGDFYQRLKARLS